MQFLPAALFIGALLAMGGAIVALSPSPTGTVPSTQVPPVKVAAPVLQSTSTTVAHSIEEILKIPWGSGPGQIGHDLPQEASAEGPMSFVVDRDGRLFVLDQVNGRVMVFPRGEPPVEIPLPTNTYQDLALDPRGGLVLMDRLVSRALLFLSDRGEIRHQIALEGPGIYDSGLATALFTQADGSWVEIEHKAMVRVALADGSPDPERLVRPGRFSSQEGKYLRAALSENNRVEIAIADHRGRLTPVGHAELATDVLQLCALETNSQGQIFVGASLFREEADPEETKGLGDQIIALTPQGQELWRTLFPPNTGPEEQFRKIRIGEDGALYKLALGEEGATLWRYVP